MEGSNERLQKGKDAEQDTGRSRSRSRVRKAPRSYRHRPAVLEKAEESDGDDKADAMDSAERKIRENLREKIQYTKDMQSFRRKRPGFDASTVLEGPAPDDGESDDGEAWDKQFHQETRRSELEKLREKYIEERMSQAGVMPPKELDALEKKLAEVEEARRKEEEELYAPLDMLMPETDAGDGLTERWATGIEEVSLPTEFRMKNIEETEKARRNQRTSRAGNRGGDRSGRATDHIVFERFKKRYLRR